MFSTTLPDSIEQVEKLERPRHIKSHLPYSMLPDQVKTKKPKVSILVDDLKIN